MKVAINTCYGGFGLSNAALKRLAKLQLGIDIYFYKEIDFDIDSKKTRYEKVNDYESDCSTITTKDLGDVTDDIPNDCILSELDLLEDRTNPYLIQVIEEMGEKANGPFSSLKIVEIPDDVKFEITDYDGSEVIEEVHRKWY